MKFEKSLTVKHAIFVEEDDLVHLVSFVTQRFPCVTLKADCGDGAVLQPGSLEELTAYENPEHRRVESIQISAFEKPNSGSHIHITLGGNGTLESRSCSARLYLEDHELATSIEREIVSRFSSMRPWYSALARLQFEYLVPALPFAYILATSAGVLAAKMAGYDAGAESTSADVSGNEATALMIAVLGVLIVVGKLLDRFRGFLFPAVSFNIGRERATNKLRQSARSTLFVSIGVGIVVNVISSAITK